LGAERLDKCLLRLPVLRKPRLQWRSWADKHFCYPRPLAVLVGVENSSSSGEGKAFARRICDEQTMRSCRPNSHRKYDLKVHGQWGNNNLQSYGLTYYHKFNARQHLLSRRIRRRLRGTAYRNQDALHRNRHGSTGSRRRSRSGPKSPITGRWMHSRSTAMHTSVSRPTGISRSSARPT